MPICQPQNIFVGEWKFLEETKLRTPHRNENNINSQTFILLFFWWEMSKFNLPKISIHTNTFQSSGSSRVRTTNTFPVLLKEPQISVKAHWDLNIYTFPHNRKLFFQTNLPLKSFIPNTRAPYLLLIPAASRCRTLNPCQSVGGNDVGFEEKSRVFKPDRHLGERNVSLG